MKVGDLVKWGSSDGLWMFADIGLVAEIGSGDGAGLAYIEWFLIPAHSGYIPIDEKMLRVINGI